MSGTLAFTVDDTALRDFDKRLSVVGKVFDKTVTGRVLRTALKPTLVAIKRNVPVGKSKFRSSATRTSRSGKIRRDGTYDRGGATKRSARIRIVDGSGEEVVRGLAGISKLRGYAGWRTHLITRANLHRRSPNDFLAKSERETESAVLTGFGDAAEIVVEKTIRTHQ